MKASIKSTQEFRPFTINLVVESEDDLRALRQLIEADGNKDCVHCGDLDDQQTLLMTALSKVLI